LLTPAGCQPKKKIGGKGRIPPSWTKSLKHWRMREKKWKGRKKRSREAEVDDSGEPLPVCVRAERKQREKKEGGGKSPLLDILSISSILQLRGALGGKKRTEEKKKKRKMSGIRRTYNAPARPGRRKRGKKKGRQVPPSTMKKKRKRKGVEIIPVSALAVFRRKKKK